MIDFFHYVSQGFPDLIQRIVSTEKFVRRLFDYYISINASEKSKAYNAYAMPCFYRFLNFDIQD